MRKTMWLLKSFGTHTSLVLDMMEAKLHDMPIFLAKGAMEPRFGSMNSKEVRSILAIGIILGNAKEATSLGVAMGELSKALAHLPPSKDSRSREEVHSG
jgi:hypothetical protein